MEKKRAIQAIISCAKNYSVNLSNQNLIFICSNAKNNFYSIEAVFLPRNFLHLTGVKVTKKGSSSFYKKCIEGALSESDFDFASNGTTEKKLQVLNYLVNIHTSARMIGDFNKNGFVLQTDKIVGNSYACLGLKQDSSYYFVPNTALKADARQMIFGEIGTIVAILRKPISERFYKEITYIKPDIEISKLPLPEQITSRLDPALFPENALKRNRNRDCR